MNKGDNLVESSLEWFVKKNHAEGTRPQTFVGSMKFDPNKYMVKRPKTKKGISSQRPGEV